ncbi:MAG: LLM class flavin-dependent oxidoreductase [Acidobacteriaceae bacterium]|nr:LLM class flavin-dependent oxidoreductase [Acidobacteriaceae bacterium]MBV8573382.1 LLM class flavin-dependent oxidoreductase [Acidobacteriaceae bacterium]
MDIVRPVRFSVLDLAPVKRGGTIQETFRNTLDLARHAERWGYTRFWLAEHHNMPGIASAATAVLIGYVAGGTSTIRVGSGGVMLPNHAPLVIAEQFGTLETLYPGRIDLGLGRAPGTDRAAIRALRRDPNSTGLEFPEQVRELLDYLAPSQPGQPVTAVPGAGTNIPVWLLGSSTFSAQLAAVLGLPFAFAAHFAPQQMLEAIELYRHLFRPSQWLNQPYVMVGIPIVAAETDSEARFLATTLRLRALQLIRGQSLLLSPPVDDSEIHSSAEERLLIQSRLSAAIVGSPETIQSKLAGFLEDTRADEIMISSDIFDHAARLRSYEVVSQVMQRRRAPASLSAPALNVS